jgi:hypothetical protein
MIQPLSYETAMEADTEGSKADSYIDTRTGWADTTRNGRAWLHLTRGAGTALGGGFIEAIVRGAEMAPELVSAIDVTATTRLMSLDPDSDISHFKFGIIQLVKLNTDTIAYAGRNRREGSIVLELARRPHWPDKFDGKFVLDSYREAIPFVQEQAPKVELRTGSDPKVTCKMYDHPIAFFPLKGQNPRTNCQNFLMRWTSDQEFLTAFVIQNKANNEIRILAHFSWRTVWKINYKWTREKCTFEPLSGTDFVVPPKVATKGPPSDSTLAEMITRPNMDPRETFNALHDKVRNDATRSLEIGYRALASDSWPAGVHPDFMGP